MRNKSAQYGFSVVEVVIIVAVVAVLGVGGLFVWQRDKDNGQNRKSKNQVSETTSNGDDVTEEPNEANTVLLADSVRLTLPEDWTYVKGSDKCRGSVTSDVVCQDGAIITPGEKLPVRYGDGTEFFHISASVFDNPRGSNARTWIEKDFDEGGPDGDDITSAAAIGGYDTYYWKKFFPGDGRDIEEITYTFAVGSKAVLLYARTYEPGVLSDGRSVGDFRQLEPAIRALAESIVIE